MKLIHTTDRLILRVLTPDYSQAVLAFYQRNKDFFAPYEPDRVDTFYTEPFHHANLTYEYNLFRQLKYLRLWIFKKDQPNVVIGSICFHNIMKGAFQSCMVGYKVDQDHCQMGYGKEALLYAVQVIFFEYGLHRIEALVLPSNFPSIKLLEGLGFEYEGISKQGVKLDGTWEDHLRYALINPL